METTSTTEPLIPCKCTHPPGRNLVVCIDGTSNQFGLNNSNVIELYSQVIKSTDQLTYYNSGVGTYAKTSWKSLKYMKQVVDNTIDLAVAWNFDRIVLAAYRWLSENYHHNDRIYLFGFSRGAYQVRTIAAMIEKVGLIHKGNEEQIPFAYELYLDRKSNEDTPREKNAQRDSQLPTELPETTRLAEPAELAEPPELTESLDLKQPKKPKGKSRAARFKKTFCRPRVNLHFIGVWDTVSSIGIVRGKSLPLTDATDHVCFVRHALALDERRVKFLPEFFAPPEPRQRPISSENTTKEDVQVGPVDVPTLKEVWFPGTHSDVGGGNRANKDLKNGKTASFWMSLEAISCGLQLELNKYDWNWNDLDDVQKSLTGVWRSFEYLPIKRFTYKKEGGTTRRLHKGKGRTIYPGQRIHASVAFCKAEYKPKAILPRDRDHKWSWDKIVGKGEKEHTYWAREWGETLEMDMFNPEAAKEVLSKLQLESGNRKLWLRRLTWMSLYPEGKNALIQVGAIPQMSELFFTPGTQYNEEGLIAFGNLLPAYSRKGSHQDAKEMIEAVLSHLPDWQPGSPPQTTLDMMHNYGLILRDCGDLKKAKEVQETVLKFREQVLEENCANLAKLITPLIATLKDSSVQGDVSMLQNPNRGTHCDTACATLSLIEIFSNPKPFEKDEEKRSEVLGLLNELIRKCYPDTINAMRSLAITLGHLGQYEEARKLQFEVLELCTDTLGKEHPNTIHAKANLAITLGNLEQFQAARELLTEVLNIRIRTLGRSHPATIHAMHNLATTLNDIGWFKEAGALNREALDISREVFGDRHPDTLQSMNNLAINLSGLERFEEAEKLQKTALDLYIEIFGEDDYQTINAVDTLVIILRRSSKLSEAKTTCRKALERSERIYGSDSPGSVQLKHDLAITLKALEEFKEAERLEYEVFEFRKKALGMEHPKTIDAMRILAEIYHKRGNTKHASKLGQEVLDVLDRHRQSLVQGQPETMHTIGDFVVTLKACGLEAEADGLEADSADYRAQQRSQHA